MINGIGRVWRVLSCGFGSWFRWGIVLRVRLGVDICLRRYDSVNLVVDELIGVRKRNWLSIMNHPENGTVFTPEFGN